jgi:integrase/recombinase XerC
MRRRRLCVVVLAASLPYREGLRVHKILREWRADWLVSGRSQHTIDNYQRTLMGLFKLQPDLDEWDMPTVKAWIADGASAQIRRMRARAVNAFMKWCREEQVTDATWFRLVKLPAVPETAQPTATEADYRRALAKAHSYRDRALLAVLWSSGMRRAEVARMRVEHLDLDGGNCLVPISKTGRFRVAPLSPDACKRTDQFSPMKVISVLRASRCAVVILPPAGPT